MKKINFIYISILALGILFFGALSPMDSIVAQGCDNGTGGDDTIICDVDRNADWEGDDGNDHMTNNAVITGSLVVGNGNDTAVNNGTVTVHIDATDDGNNTIINNGTVQSDILGGTGNNVIINNGIVGDDIWGGGANGGTTVINNGKVMGRIGGWSGDDTIIITGGSTVGGLIDGWGGNDTLIFQASYEATADVYDALSADIAAAAQAIMAKDPNGGTVTIHGQIYTWTNVDELVALLRVHLVMFHDGRVNKFDIWSTAVIYCGYNSIVIYTPEGVYAYEVPMSTITAAVRPDINTLVHSSMGIDLWVLSTGEVQIMGPDGYMYIFEPQVCAVSG